MTKSVGEGLKAFNWFTKFFSREEYHERVEDSLIGTSDEIITLLSARKNETKKIKHFVKQYKANRKKLK